MTLVRVACPWCGKDVDLDEAAFRVRDELRCDACGTAVGWADASGRAVEPAEPASSARRGRPEAAVKPEVSGGYASAKSSRHTHERSGGRPA